MSPGEKGGSMNLSVLYALILVIAIFLVCSVIGAHFTLTAYDTGQSEVVSTGGLMPLFHTPDGVVGDAIFIVDVVVYILGMMTFTVNGGPLELHLFFWFLGIIMALCAYFMVRSGSN